MRIRTLSKLFIHLKNNVDLSVMNVIGRIAHTAKTWAGTAFLISVLVGLPSTYLQAQPEEIDGIVAIVDTDVVLRSELSTRFEAIKGRFAGNTTQLPPDDILRAQVLDHLILERIQLTTAARFGIQVLDDEVTQSFSELAVRNNLTEQQLLSRMVESGESPSGIFRDIRNELTVQKLQQALVNQRIFISDGEIENFLNSSEGQLWAAPSLNIQHILIPLSGDASPADVSSAQTLAASVYEKLQTGSDFGTLAVQFSSGPSALKGGSLGWRRAVEFQPELAKVLQNAEIQTPTQPTRAAGGLHIFLVHDIRGGTEAEFIQQTETRHILLKPNTIRSDEETKQLAQELRERALNGEDFSDLAHEYSEDISNAMNGGYLDWVLPGAMVPSFEQAMDSTAEGDISQPIKTQFGWHILRVEARRDVDMSTDIMRNQARNVLQNQRFEEELDLWQRELRSDAFVSIIKDK